MLKIRQPIVVVLGHVDSGKTSILDKIRGTGVQEREAGGITQHIGASFLPIETLKKICGPLYKKLEESEHQIPGILVIDTPGHEIFTNLRARGGSAADIAILVVDVNRGFQPQTNESLKILESRKVPFMIALNKTDQISGWRPTETNFISQAIKEQDQFIQTTLDEQIYNVVGTLSVLGYQSEAFWRVKDYKKEIAIVPVSARTGVGIPELLTVLVGLAQQYLQKKLTQEQKPPRGIVLEVNDEVGLGPTANIILVDGSLNKDNTILVAKRDGVIVTKPKVILLPKPLDEMRDPRDKFKPVEEVHAAAGVKIASPDLEGVLPGSTVYVASNESEIAQFKKEIEAEMASVFIDQETSGITLKCDTIGSLEAITEMLKREQIPVAKADIGPTHEEDAIFVEFTPIVKFTFLKGYVFRNNDPAVFGIRVDVGTLRQKVRFMRMDGKEIGKIHQLQESGKTVESAETGKEVACSVKGVTIGRQISEEDVFYTLPTSNEVKYLLKKYSHKLSSEQFNLLNEIVEIQRKKDPAYGY